MEQEAARKGARLSPEAPLCGRPRRKGKPAWGETEPKGSQNYPAETS